MAGKPTKACQNGFCEVRGFPPLSPLRQMGIRILELPRWLANFCPVGGRASITDPCSSQHDFSPLFHSPTCFEKLPTNARHRRQIGARSREWQSLSVNYQRRDLRESPMRRRHSKIFVMLNIWSCRRFTILLCEWVLTESYIGDLSMREQNTGQREALRTFFFLLQSHLQTTCLHFGIRIYRSGRLHNDEEGARVFPVNNILLYRTKYLLHYFFFITLRAFIGYKKINLL